MPDDRSSAATILIVDDTPENLTVLADALRGLYRVRAATSGQRALEAARTAPRPDLILLDVMMPGMSGHEVLEALKRDPELRDTPVIFCTAMSSDADEESGLALGAVDYITKPIRPAIVRARVHAQIELGRARARLRQQNESLEAEVGRRMRENVLIQDAGIHALAGLAETRDPETGNHIRRTSEYVRLLAQHLARSPRHAAELDERAISTLAKSAPLHDIGKVGIPDHILLKPGPLTPDEWEIMKTHAQIGADAIARAEREAGAEIPFLRYAKEIAGGHHEKWDGSGYPRGLAGEAIPLAARLMALADVFDALTTRRVYKRAYSFAEARRIIDEGRGQHFDPAVVDAFAANFGAFCDTATRYADPEPSADPAAPAGRGSPADDDGAGRA